MEKIRVVHYSPAQIEDQKRESKRAANLSNVELSTSSGVLKAILEQCAHLDVEQIADGIMRQKYKMSQSSRGVCQRLSMPLYLKCLGELPSVVPLDPSYLEETNVKVFSIPFDDPGSIPQELSDRYFVRRSVVAISNFLNSEIGSHDVAISHVNIKSLPSVSSRLVELHWIAIF